MFETIFGGGKDKKKPPPKPVLREDSGEHPVPPGSPGTGSGVEAGGGGERREASVTHTTTPSEASASPPEERIPTTLQPATRALAERTLPLGEKWGKMNLNMRQAIQALGQTEAAFSQSMLMQDLVRTQEGDIPVWQYIGQCVDAIGNGQISVIEELLNHLLENPNTTPIACRIVALHAAQVVLGCPIMQLAAVNPMQYGRLTIEQFNTRYPAEGNKLKAIGAYVGAHSQALLMAKEFFGFNVPLLGNQNPMEDVLKHYGLM